MYSSNYQQSLHMERFSRELVTAAKALREQAAIHLAMAEQMKARYDREALRRRIPKGTIIEFHPVYPTSKTAM